MEPAALAQPEQQDALLRKESDLLSSSQVNRGQKAQLPQMGVDGEFISTSGRPQ